MFYIRQGKLFQSRYKLFRGNDCNRKGGLIMSELFSVGKFGKEIYRTYVIDQPNHFAASISYYSFSWLTSFL